ncbi:hypothetical protein [Streptomyces sp. NBC_01568]|uniref:hypothetical protein n=1 Tax=Streptomyces sp. NBC_01568 TaxID=2975882 RepID=UPI00386FF3A1
MAIQQVSNDGTPAPLQLIFTGECGKTTEVAVTGISFQFKCSHGQEQSPTPRPATNGASTGDPYRNIPHPIDFDQGPIALAFRMDAEDLGTFVNHLTDVDTEGQPFTVRVPGDPGTSDLWTFVDTAAKQERPLRLVFGYDRDRE